MPGAGPGSGRPPRGVLARPLGIERFARLLVESAAPYAAAIKPNLAFFEAFGSDGLAVLERIRATLPPDLPVVLDGKRADIGTTVARQAVALFDRLGADAVTVNPYLGSEAVAPLLDRQDRFAYILCRTTNPGAGELQSLLVAADPDAGAPAEPLYVRVARLASTWGPGATVGLVAAATAPAELASIRATAPGLPFLIPGIGAQGGQLEPVLEHGPATAAPGTGRPGKGLLVNVSRAIAAAASGAPTPGGAVDLGERLAAAARDWASRLPVLP